MVRYLEEVEVQGVEVAEEVLLTVLAVEGEAVEEEEEEQEALLRPHHLSLETRGMRRRCRR